jgi:hypothetical protein
MNENAKQSNEEPEESISSGSWKDALLSLVTGFLLFIAVSLLLNPHMEKLKATWVMYYRDF